MILVLAPMEGVVDPVIRRIYTDIGGYNLCVTEFIRVTGNLLSPKTFYKYCPELKNDGKTKAGTPVFVQLLGSDPVSLSENALLAKDLGAPGIDLNFGCPAKTVNRHDGGASLLKDPNRIYKILTELRKHLPKDYPLTAKVRLGFEDKSLHKEIAKAVEDGGADWIAIHARTKKEAYKPPAHWEYIASMKDEISIPVFANGDIWTTEDLKRCKEVSGCEDFFIGRGAFTNPGLANQIHHRFDQESKSELSKKFPFLKTAYKNNLLKNQWTETYPHYQSFLKLNYSVFGDYHSIKRGKQWIKFLGNTYPEAKQLFQETKGLQSFAEICKLNHLDQEAMPRTSIGEVFA